MFYKLKNYVVDAVQWDGTIPSADEIEVWSEDRTHCRIALENFPEPHIIVPGVFCPNYAFAGDFIIKLNDGYFVVMSEEQFFNLYESM